jgi:CRISPR/Cas system-associated exonuclease Cas4 (RecB family)
MPSLPSLVGDVTHNALEKILAELVRRGCSSPNTACAVGALKAMGGYTRVITEDVALKLQALDTNPRAKDRVPALRATMQVRVPEMRNRVQAVLSRSEFQPSPRSNVNAGVASGARLDPSAKRGERLPLAPGSYAEVTLRAESIRWSGRVDLLTIAADDTAIVDYKTGLPDDSHVEQLRLYALLWYRDKDRNPSATRASRLTIAYPNTDVTIEALSQAQLKALEDELESRVGVARRGLEARPPEARPSTTLCASCPVRQLCEEYWEFLDGDPSPVHEGALAWGA